MSELTSPKDKTKKNKPFSVWVGIRRFLCLCLSFAKNYPQSVLHFCSGSCSMPMDYHPFVFVSNDRDTAQARQQKQNYAMAQWTRKKNHFANAIWRRWAVSSSESIIIIIKYKINNDLIDITCMINWMAAGHWSECTHFVQIPTMYQQ